MCFRAFRALLSGGFRCGGCAKGIASVSFHVLIVGLHFDGRQTRVRQKPQNPSLSSRCSRKPRAPCPCGCCSFGAHKPLQHSPQPYAGRSKRPIRSVALLCPRIRVVTGVSFSAAGAQGARFWELYLWCFFQARTS